MRTFIVAEDGLPHVKEHHSTTSAEGWVVTQTRLNKAQWGCVLPVWAKFVTRDSDGSWWAYAFAPDMENGYYLAPDGDTLEICELKGACAPRVFNLDIK